MQDDFEEKLASFKQRLDELSEKVRRAAEVISQLKTQRDNLRVELDFLREENKQARVIISENEKLQKNQIWIENKMKKILKKLEAAGI